MQTRACLLLNDVCLVCGKSQVVCGIQADPSMSSVEWCMSLVVGDIGSRSQWLLQCSRQSFLADISVSTRRLYVPAVTSLWLFWHLYASLAASLGGHSSLKKFQFLESPWKQNRVLKVLTLGVNVHWKSLSFSTSQSSVLRCDNFAVSA